MGSGPTKELSLEASKILKKQVNHVSNPDIELATFAGGCFWSLELAFQRVPGVVETQVGYTQGNSKDPTYEEVCSGSTGHTEAVQLKFDKSSIGYEDLLVVFWDLIDPTLLNQQGNDIGSQYRTGIYFHNQQQKNFALISKSNVQKKYASPVVTEILEAQEWYPAENYHQHYLEKNGQSSKKGDLSPIRCYG